MTAYFVTSIGTGIGKTFTTCALLHAARMKGFEAYGYKPIISGWDDSDATDTAQIIAAGGGAWKVEEVSPWRFAAPLSPHMAAPLEKKSLTLDAVVQWSQSRPCGQFALMEGVGGVMVPLNQQHTSLDWMQALGWPVILVTGSYLGSISHTLTALDVLNHAGVKVAALVMNESEGASVDFASACEGLKPFIQNIPLQIFQPRVSSWKEARETHALLTQL